MIGFYGASHWEPAAVDQWKLLTSYYSNNASSAKSWSTGIIKGDPDSLYIFTVTAPYNSTYGMPNLDMNEGAGLTWTRFNTTSIYQRAVMTQFWAYGHINNAALTYGSNINSVEHGHSLLQYQGNAVVQSALSTTSSVVRKSATASLPMAPTGPTLAYVLASHYAADQITVNGYDFHHMIGNPVDNYFRRIHVFISNDGTQSVTTSIPNASHHTIAMLEVN